MLYEWHFLSKHKESAASNFVSTLQSDIMCCQSQQKLNHREGCIFMSWLLCDKNLHTNCTYYINVLPLHGNKQPLIHTLLDNTFFCFFICSLRWKQYVCWHTYIITFSLECQPQWRIRDFPIIPEDPSSCICAVLSCYRNTTGSMLT